MFAPSARTDVADTPPADQAATDKAGTADIAPCPTGANIAVPETAADKGVTDTASGVIGKAATGDAATTMDTVDTVVPQETTADQ